MHTRRHADDATHTLARAQRRTADQRRQRHVVAVVVQVLEHRVVCLVRLNAKALHARIEQPSRGVTPGAAPTRDPTRHTTPSAGLFMFVPSGLSAIPCTVRRTCASHASTARHTPHTLFSRTRPTTPQRARRCGRCRTSCTQDNSGFAGIGWEGTYGHQRLLAARQ
jgi:hypothetical protein